MAKYCKHKKFQKRRKESDRHAERESSPRSLGGEFVNRFLPVDGAGCEDYRWKIRMVHRIGKMLRFQAERRVLAVMDSSLAHNAAVEKIAGVELDAWLGGPDLHLTTRARVKYARGNFQFP